MRYSGSSTFLLAAMMAAALAGCSAASQGLGSWTKAQTSPDQQDKDLSSCKAYAYSETKVDRNTDQDQAALNGTVSSGLTPGLNQNINAYGTQKRYNALVRDCMTGLGYSEVH
jgi:hypothetical protein